MSISFTELSMAAYCPRKLYYARTDDREPPPVVEERRDLAFRYDELLEADEETLAATAIAVSPATYRRNLARVRDRVDCWDGLVDPPERDVRLRGRECRGVVHKVVTHDGPVPSLVSTGSPPERGVWRPQTVRAVAAAKALSWERERAVEEAFVEYPAYGVVRRVQLTTRRKASYRAAVRAVRAIDGPPPRVKNRSKCATCEYRDRCGVRTRSVRSMLEREEC